MLKSPTFLDDRLELEVPMTSSLIASFDMRPVGSLESYISYAYQIPMLTEAEEKELTLRFFEKQDLQAARQLVLAHLRFVVKIARAYEGYGLAHADLIQEGNIGLMKAVKRFDPSKGVRLVTFAVHWIKAEIHEFIIRNWRIVKIATTKAQRKLFFNLRTMKKRLGWFTDEEVNFVATELNVKPEAVRHMEARMNHHDTSFETPSIEDDENSAAFVPSHYLEDERANPELMLSEQRDEESSLSQLRKALTSLDKRSQDILHQRWLADKKATLEDLAEKYGVSAERVRQIEVQAMKKVKAAVQ